MCRKDHIAEEQSNKLGPNRGVCDLHIHGWKREDGGSDEHRQQD